MTPTGRDFTGELQVRIECATDGATIYYTTDGSEPTFRSEKYDGPIKLNHTATIRAIAGRDDMWASPEARQIYRKKDR